MAYRKRRVNREQPLPGSTWLAVFPRLRERSWSDVRLDLVPHRVLAILRGFQFIDDELLAIPTHGDVILRTLHVTCVRQQVLTFHAVEMLVVFHLTMPSRKTSPCGVGRCSSSSNVKPPGPGRQVSSPVLTRPLGVEESDSNFTLSDHFPVRAFVRLLISSEGCGADVSDCAFARPMAIPQTLRWQSESDAVLKSFFLHV